MKSTPIAILKSNRGRMPVQSKAGNGLNSSNVPYAPVAKIRAIANPLQRRPIGRK
jgi:hypothetical protein